MFAQYICPGSGDNAELNKIIINGNTYDIVSRSIMLNRTKTDTLTVENYKSLGAVASNVSGEKLSTSYWSLTDNNDGTSTVTFSILMKKINKVNAESKLHTSRALIQYKDYNNSTQKLYSSQVVHK